MSKGELAFIEMFIEEKCIVLKTDAGMLGVLIDNSLFPIRKYTCKSCHKLGLTFKELLYTYCIDCATSCVLCQKKCQNGTISNKCLSCVLEELDET